MTLSWFELERYALGELSAEEKKAVEAALATDAKARARLAEIRGEAVSAQAPVEKKQYVRLLAAMVTLALAALISRALLQDDPSGAKGDDLTLSIVRQHDGAVAAESLKLVLGDKYSLQVTCVPPRETALLVRITQNGEVSEPLGSEQQIRCANDVPLAAFVFDSVAPAEVCVFDRALAKQSCVTLR